MAEVEKPEMHERRFRNFIYQFRETGLSQKV
jgi:hypothetical protein